MHIEIRKTLVATQKPDKAINSFCQKCIRFHIVCHLSDSQEAIALNGNYMYVFPGARHCITATNMKFIILHHL